MDKQLVSILVPIYNGQKFLTEFLDSIKKQTYRPIELILRDDCSKMLQSICVKNGKRIMQSVISQ